jgi:predicted DNA-binding protein
MRRYTKKLTVQIDPGDYEKMCAIADKLGRTVGACVRRAIAAYIAKHQSRESEAAK